MNAKLQSQLREQIKKLDSISTAPAILKPELEAGLLHILPCTTKLPRNDYFVIYPRTALHPAGQAVADLAVRVAADHPAFCN